MSKLTEKELDGLSNEDLVFKMDEILTAPYWSRRGNQIMKLCVENIFETERVQSFSQDFQRNVIYKAFGLLLQLHYTEFSSSAQFFRVQKRDELLARQLYSSARKQWVCVSSRIIFEYFIHLTYMLGTGEEFEMGRSAMKKFKKWLREKDNPYTYFSISVMRAELYDRKQRTPEVHASTKLARQILLASATNIDNDMFEIVGIIKNQWQFILHIANGKNPRDFGWVSSGKNVVDDKKWYEIWRSGDQKRIDIKIDQMFKSYDNQSNSAD